MGKRRWTFTLLFFLPHKSSSSLRVGLKGVKRIIRFPSKNGYVESSTLPWDLWPFRVEYAPCYSLRLSSKISVLKRFFAHLIGIFPFSVFYFWVWFGSSNGRSIRFRISRLWPRLFIPAVKCPECYYPNDHDFRFCQRCGFQRAPPQPTLSRLAVSPNFAELDTRLDHLHSLSVSAVYSRQKESVKLS